MRFRFVWIGKTKDKHWKALQEAYLRRLSFFAKCDLAEIRESAPHEGKEIEGKRILELLNQKSLAVVLDPKGKQLTSDELAKQVERWRDTGRQEVTFVIGGPDGVASGVVERADLRLSLSFLTFTHEMARVVLLEQLYRAFTIVKGFPYQK
jgi:23S rRNA (pseudouridine1915-N3)-methyltransferase